LMFYYCSTSIVVRCGTVVVRCGSLWSVVVISHTLAKLLFKQNQI